MKRGWRRIVSARVVLFFNPEKAGFMEPAASIVISTEVKGSRLRPRIVPVLSETAIPVRPHGGAVSGPVLRSAGEDGIAQAASFCRAALILLQFNVDPH